MDITNEEAVWEVLMQPITVVDGNEKSFVYLRAEPSEDAEAVGEITCSTQGVHVLENLENGWSRGRGLFQLLCGQQGEGIRWSL